MLQKTQTYTAIIALIAAIGLLQCSKKSSIDLFPPPGGQSGGGGGLSPTGDIDPGYTHEDPTFYHAPEFTVTESQHYRPLLGDQAVFTGGRNKDHWNYTDTQDDALMQRVLRALSGATFQEQQRNKEFASRFQIQQVLVDSQNPSGIQLSYTYKEHPQASTKYYQSLGVLQSAVEPRFVQLTNSNTRNTIISSARCLDAGTTCHNLLIKFLLPTGPVAYAIVRTSPVNLQFFAENMFQQLHDDHLQDRSLRRFYRLLQNSSSAYAHTGERRRRITHIVLESVAIANGSSHFSLFIKTQTRDGQQRIIPLTGELLRQQGQSNHIGLPIANLKSTVLKDYSQEDLDDVYDNILSGELLENNGRGSFQLELFFGADQHPSGRVVLTLSRTPVPLIHIPNLSL